MFVIVPESFREISILVPMVAVGSCYAIFNETDVA